MQTDRSYKIALAFAITIHAIIAILFCVKFTSQSNIYVTKSSSIIQAVAINQNDIDNQKITTPPQPKSAPKPILPQPKIEKPIPPPPKPQPKPIPKTQPIALKQRLEAVQKKQDLLLQKQLESERRQLAVAAAAKLQQQKQLAMQKMLQNQLAAEQKQLADAHGRQVQGIVDKYKAMIIQAISSQWIIPDGVAKDATCQILVSLAPDGTVLNIQLLSSSGNPVLDRSAQTAVKKASPLPVPKEPALFDDFRSFKLTVRPEGIVNG